MKVFDYELFAKTFRRIQFDRKEERNGNLSTRSLAIETNTTASTVSRASNGKPIDINNVIAFCEWMGKDLSEFIKTT